MHNWRHEKKFLRNLSASVVTNFPDLPEGKFTDNHILPFHSQRSLFGALRACGHFRVDFRATWQEAQNHKLNTIRAADSAGALLT